MQDAILPPALPLPRLEALASLLAELRSWNDPLAHLDRFTSAVAEILDAGQCVCILYDPQQEAFVPRWPAYGLTQEQIQGVAFPSIQARAFLDQIPPRYSVVLMPHAPYFDAQIARRWQERILLVARLQVRDEVLGALRVANPRGRTQFNRVDGLLLGMAADQFALALEHHRVRSELEDRVAARTAALARSEARYRQLVESPLVGIWQADLDGRFVYVNPYLLALSGYREEEVIGQRTMLDVIAPEYRAWLAERLRQRALDQAPVDVVEVELLHKDGSRVSVLAAPATLYDETGRVAGFIGALIDVTPRVKLAADLAQQVETQKRLVHLMAGREVRMAELKEKLRVLRAQLLAAGMTPAVDDDALDVVLPAPRAAGQHESMEP